MRWAWVVVVVCVTSSESLDLDAWHAAIGKTAVMTHPDAIAAPDGVPVAEVSANPGKAAQYLVEDGLLKVTGAFDTSLSTALLEMADKQVPLNTSPMNHYNVATELTPLVFNAVKSVMKGIAGLLTERLTPDGKLEELALMINDPRGDYQKWHADTVHTDTAAPMYTVWIAIEDVTLDMGPTEVLPRTHNKTSLILCNDAYESGKECSPGRTPVGVTMQKGDLAIMDSSLFHRAGNNRSSKRRRILYFSMSGKGDKPEGSTYTLLPALKRAQLRLRDWPDWDRVYEKKTLAYLRERTGLSEDASVAELQAKMMELGDEDEGEEY